MANSSIYTRVYSPSRVSRFVSRKGPDGGSLSNAALLEDFRNHANISNRKPTALVSASRRIVDTLKRAFNKHNKHGKSPAKIWIAFIEVPSIRNETPTRIHSARQLAEKCNLPEPESFSYEVVFEWTIPDKYVLHKVSLQTLMERGLQKNWFLPQSTAEVRRYIAREFQQCGPWEIGVTLGFFARNFGARAPLNWIPDQLFRDCVRPEIVGEDVVMLGWAPEHTEKVDFQFFCDLENGIETSLCDWWLSDLDFFRNCERFKEWQEGTEDSMTWDLIELWETHVGRDGTINQLSAWESSLYDEEKKKLLVEHKKTRAAIRAEAVRIGL